MRLDSRKDAVEYFCELHNALNRKLGKPMADCKAMSKELCDKCNECQRRASTLNLDNNL